MKNEIDTSFATIIKKESGIVHITYKKGTKQTLSQSQSVMESTFEMSDFHPSLIISDLRNIVSVDSESKAYFQSEETAKKVKGLAVIIDGYFTKFLTNFLLQSKGISFPIQSFNNLRKAEEWLLTL